MKLTLHDTIGNSVEFDSAPTDIIAISKIAEKHLISPTEARSHAVGSNIIFVDDIMSVIRDYISSTTISN